MKNLQTFNEFVNESYANKSGKDIMDFKPNSIMLSYIEIIAKALGVKANDMKIIGSGFGEHFTDGPALWDFTTPEYNSADLAFKKGTSKDIKLPKSKVPEGPYAMVNKRAGIARYEEEGFTAYFFTDKSKF
jgi:hypothetical protein